MRPSCVRPWWIQPSTCFSSKWRVNWNRLKTNWSRPKMNWVPGNLHLIGKDNQNNSPLQNKTKKSRFPHAPHPHSHCRHAGTIVGEKGWHMPYSPRDSDFTESQSLQNKPLFVLLHCASYITHNLTWKKTVWSGDTCVSALTAQGPEGVRIISRRGGHSLSPTWICRSRLSLRQTVYTLTGEGLWWRLS